MYFVTPRTGDGSPGRYESRRPQTTSPSSWNPPPVDPTCGWPYSPSRRYRPEHSSTSDSSLFPVPYDLEFRRPQSTSFSPDRPPRHPSSLIFCLKNFPYPPLWLRLVHVYANPFSFELPVGDMPSNLKSEVSTPFIEAMYYICPWVLCIYVPE